MFWIVLEVTYLGIAALALNMNLTKISMMMALKMKLTTFEREDGNEGTKRRNTNRIARWKGRTW